MANDFTGDSNCVALWRFEDGALTTDTIGTNTLTNNGGVVSNQVDFKEGAASADFEAGSTQYMSITDANLDANFPLKNGDVVKTFSICARFQIESYAGFPKLYSKWDSTLDKRSFQIVVSNTGLLQVYFGVAAGAGNEKVYEDVTLVTGRFYHLGFTYDNADKGWKLVVWDDTGQVKVINTSGTSANRPNIEDASVVIGGGVNDGSPSSTWDGEIDEVLVFKDVLSTGEIDQIRAGTYSSGTITELEDVRLNLSAYYQDLSDLAAWLKAHDGLEFEDLPTILAAFLQDTEDLPAHLSAYHQDLEGIMLNLQTWAWSIDDVKTELETQGLSLSDLTAAFAASGWRLGDIETFLAATDAIVRKDLAAMLWATDGIVTDDFPVYLCAIAFVPAFRSITAQRLTSVVSEVA